MAMVRSLYRRRIVLPALLAVCLGALGRVALADSVTVGALQYNGVRIVGVKNGEIQFETATNLVSKPLSVVSRISLSDEPALTAAEDAFAKGDWDKANENYEKVLRSVSAPNKAWLKDWCSMRLQVSATKSGRFDVVMRGFVELTRKSPDEARKLFASLKMPKAGSDYLKQAATMLETEIAQSKNGAATEVMLGALKDIYSANNEQAKATATAQKLVELAAKRDPNSPEAQRAMMEIQLQNMRKALGAKNYAAVIEFVEKNAAKIIDPNDQIDALFLYAEAKAGKAAGSSNADWNDVAVTYMRVVANAPAGDPRTPLALLRTAEIHAAHLNDKPAAMRMYREIIKQYKDTDAAKQAQMELGKLEK